MGVGLEWRAASGRATVHSFTIEHNPAATGATFSGGQPYVVALVDLAEGVRMLTNVIGCDPADVVVGLAVDARPGSRCPTAASCHSSLQRTNGGPP